MPITSTSPFRILYHDAMRDISSIATTGTATGFSTDSLKDFDRATFWRSSILGDVAVRFTLAAARDVEGIGILNHNIESSGCTHIYWQKNTGTYGTPVWTNIIDFLPSVLGDNDFFAIANANDNDFRLYLPGATTTYVELGRVFMGEETFYLADTSQARAQEGSGAGFLTRGELFETLSGIEHSHERGNIRQRQLWVFDRIDSTDSANIKALVNDLQYAETFIISDPEVATSKTYGRAIHVRLNNPEFLRSWQIASREACVLDMVERL